MISYIEEKFDGESTALYATARLWDDGLIDPRDTREVIAQALSICEDAEKTNTQPINLWRGTNLISHRH